MKFQGNKLPAICTIYNLIVYKLFIIIPYIILELEICMKCFLSHAPMKGKIKNATMKNKFQIKLFIKKKEQKKKCQRITSGGVTRLEKWVQKHEKNRISPEEEVDLEARDRSVLQILQEWPQREIPARRSQRVNASLRLGSIQWVEYI